MSQHKIFDMTGFFEVLVDAIKPFRSPHNIKGHNFHGCRVLQGKQGGRKEGFWHFAFIARGGESEVIIEIDMARLDSDPKGYCDQLMDNLDEIFKRVRLDQRITVAVPKQMEKVLETKQKPALQLISGALH